MPQLKIQVSKTADAAIAAKLAATGETIETLFAPWIADVVAWSGASTEDDEATQLADIAVRSTRVAARKAAKLAAQG